MNQIFKIAASLMLLVLLTAEDCSDSSYETTRVDKLSVMFSEIEDDFVNDELTQETLSAFEKRAGQKLYDIVDYMNIYSDTSLYIQFRKQAKQMIQKNFNTTYDELKFYITLGLVEDSLNAVIYYSENLKAFKTSISSSSITEHLQLNSISEYSGQIEFTQEVVFENSTGIIETNTFQRQLQILSLKTSKVFGDKTEEVWEVYFGMLK